MTRFLIFLAGVIPLCAQTAMGCEPPAVYYEPLAVKASAHNPTVTEFISQNAPAIRDVSIGRGTAAQESLCGGQGYVAFTIALPAGAPVTFADVGIEFRVVEGAFPGYALPEGPIRSILGPKEDFQHLGSWFEGPPAKHKPLYAMVEVSFVAPDGTRGKPARFTLSSKPDKPMMYDSLTR